MGQKKEVPVKKNDYVTITIEDLGTTGDGVGRYHGYTLFVKEALPHEVVRVKVIKVKKKYGFAIVDKILEPSAQRLTPVCEVAGPCGGCSLQHLSYPGQLEMKRKRIEDTMERIGECSHLAVEGVLGMDEPYHYRNKVQYPVRDNGRGLEIGFYAKGSHRIVRHKKCYIQDSYNDFIIQQVRECMTMAGIKGYDERQHKGLIRHVVIRKSYQEDVFHITFVCLKKPSQANEKSLVDFFSRLDKVAGIAINIQPARSNVVMGRQTETVYGLPYLKDSIGQVQYHISPNSFYQVNPIQTEKLYATVMEFADLSGHETVVDLYCGIGSISLYLAQKAGRVYGVESIPEAIEDARENARINKITNTEFHLGKAEEIMPLLAKEKELQVDLLVVDPPRKGLDKSLIQTIGRIKPKQVVYVSCDVSTQARDVKLLRAYGYEIEKIQGVDMFPQTPHVETVVLLSRAEK